MARVKILVGLYVLRPESRTPVVSYRKANACYD